MKKSLVCASLVATLVLMSGGMADAAAKWKISKPKGEPVASHASIPANGTGTASSLGFVRFGHVTAAGVAVTESQIGISGKKWAVTFVPPAAGWVLSAPDPTTPLLRKADHFMLADDTFTPGNNPSIVLGFTVVP